MNVVAFTLIPLAAMVAGAAIVSVRTPTAAVASAIQHFAAGVEFTAVASEILPDLWGFWRSPPGGSDQIVVPEDWRDVGTHVVSLAMAFGLAISNRLGRERSEGSTRLRTFPVVAITARRLVLIVARIQDIESAEHARVLEDLITGISVIGVARSSDTKAALRARPRPPISGRLAWWMPASIMAANAVAVVIALATLAPCPS